MTSSPSSAPCRSRMGTSTEYQWPGSSGSTRPRLLRRRARRRRSRRRIADAPDQARDAPCRARSCRRRALRRDRCASGSRCRLAPAPRAPSRRPASPAHRHWRARAPGPPRVRPRPPSRNHSAPRSPGRRAPWQPGVWPALRAARRCASPSAWRGAPRSAAPAPPPSASAAVRGSRWDPRSAISPVLDWDPRRASPRRVLRCGGFWAVGRGRVDPASCHPRPRLSALRLAGRILAPATLTDAPGRAPKNERQWSANSSAIGLKRRPRNVASTSWLLLTAHVQRPRHQRAAVIGHVIGRLGGQEAVAEPMTDEAAHHFQRPGAKPDRAVPGRGSRNRDKI